MTRSVKAGLPYPLGAHFDGDGVNFALFSANAEKVELCLFDAAGQHETDRVALPERSDDVWHGHLPDVKPGQLYGYRVHGPYDPEAGHRFNPNKLLIDPYARALDRSFRWDDRHCGYTVGDARGDLSFDRCDNAADAPKCRVLDPHFNWEGDRNPATPMARSVIYELHLCGFTMRHPAIGEGLRGTAAGLASPEIVAYLRGLGVSAVELLPIQPVALSRALWQNGLTDYWGYNSIAFFAIEPRYLAGGTVDEFKRMVRVFHDAGLEVILDMVFNHSGEGDEFGPTLSFRGIDNKSYYCLAENPRHYLDFTGCKNSLNIEHPRVLQLVMDSLRYWVEDMHVDGFRFDLAVSLARANHHFAQDAAFFAAVAQDPVLARVKLIAEPWDLGPDGYQLGNFPARWSEWNDKYRDGMRRFWRGDGSLGEFAQRLTGSADRFAASGRPPSASINFVTAHDGFTLEDLVSYAAKHNHANGENNRDGADENYSANNGVEGKTDDPAILAGRLRQKRNFMASLLLSEGVPMLAAGDELGHSQQGNNNAYCQDNETSWIDWDSSDRDFANFVRALIRLRAAAPIFRRTRFFDGGSIESSADILWLLPDGSRLREPDWHAPDRRAMAVRYLDKEADTPCRYLLLLNASAMPVTFRLLPGDWHMALDTAAAKPPPAVFAGQCERPAHSLALLREAILA
jgi:isoamylase